MSNRKPFNDRAGYIASRRNVINRGWVVIYLAKEQGLDETAGKYAVVCETHNTILQTTSLPKARPCMKYPEFCETCMYQHNGLDFNFDCSVCGNQVATTDKILYFKRHCLDCEMKKIKERDEFIRKQQGL